MELWLQDCRKPNRFPGHVTTAFIVLYIPARKTNKVTTEGEMQITQSRICFNYLCFTVPVDFSHLFLKGVSYKKPTRCSINFLTNHFTIYRNTELQEFQKPVFQEHGEVRKTSFHNWKVACVLNNLSSRIATYPPFSQMKDY